MRKMAMHTVATLPRLSSTELSQILLSTASSNLDTSTPPSKIAIVDVRDDGMTNFALPQSRLPTPHPLHAAS